MRKPAFCICENKDADQLRGNLEADQRLYFRYVDSSFNISSLFHFSLHKNVTTEGTNYKMQKHISALWR